MSLLTPRYRPEALNTRRTSAGVPIVLSALPDTVVAAALLSGVLVAATCALFYGRYTVRLQVPVTLQAIPAETSSALQPMSADLHYAARFSGSPTQLSRIAAGQTLTLGSLPVPGSPVVHGLITAVPAKDGACPPVSTIAQASTYRITVPRGALPVHHGEWRADASIALAEQRLIDWLF